MSFVTTPGQGDPLVPRPDAPLPPSALGAPTSANEVRKEYVPERRERQNANALSELFQKAPVLYAVVMLVGGLLLALVLLALVNA